MSDLIERQDAIDAIAFGITYAKVIDIETGEKKELLLFKKVNSELEEAIERVNLLPSAEPKRGKWIDIDADFSRKWFKHHMYKCSECGNTLDFDGVNAGRGDANFCPNCGARMDEEE